jgi:hypothetical protein
MANNGRFNSGKLLFVFVVSFRLAFRSPFGYGLGFCSADFRKEPLGCGWSRHLA